MTMEYQNMQGNSMPQAPYTPPVMPPKKTGKQSFWELARFAILAVIIVVPIRMFIAQPFIVSGSSMVPTFEDGQYLIVDEISYHLENPVRDDVVVFRYPKDPSKFFIKRIIGLPGETVDIKGSDVYITNSEHPDGFKLDQSYVKNESQNNTHFELKDGEYFVMGDNRSASSDSRYWGAVPKNLLIGKVFLRLLPVKEAGVFPGKFIEPTN
jgi:signal peptidase I